MTLPRSEASAGVSSRVLRLLATGLALLWLTLGLLNAWRSSATTDEFNHIIDGYTVLTLGDRRFNPEHPPLVKLAAVLPAHIVYPLAVGEHLEGQYGVPFDRSMWGGALAGPYAQVALQATDEVPFQHRLFACRLVPLLWGLLGGVLTFLLALRLTGSPLAGLAAATTLLFYPDYLGHAGLVTMDVPTATSAAAMALAAMAWWRRPDARRMAVVAVVAGAGSLVKLPVSVYIAFSLFLLAGISVCSGGRIAVRRLAALFLCVFLAAWLAAWIGAGFRFGYLGEGQRIVEQARYIPPVDNPDGRPILSLANALHRLRLLPESTLGTITVVDVFRGRQYFLNGVWSRQGFLTYFAETALLKTPLTLLLGFPLALAMLIRRRRVTRGLRWRLQLWAILLIPMALQLALFVSMRANLGHRYVLFAYVPVAVVVGAGVAEAWRRGLLARSMATGLLAAHVLVCVNAWPHHIAYFNPLGGPLPKAVNLVRDSNTDLGQDTGDLGRLVHREGVPRVNLALVAHNLPEVWGIEDYRMILPGETLSFTRSFQTPSEPDPSAPTAVSINLLDQVRERYPGFYDRPPDRMIGSIAWFDP